ncbi:hypothetical protein [Geofilum rhodophaeum]|uniref:hypothetical protein n=1 Tax=Geofilum rhodophaeum TaxID=1965019 RepID=UPI000B5277B0|nr:hypothetical protein [Geofilum rhodophaeum]
MNYKVIYLKLKERYPEIAKELTAKERPLDGYEMLKVFTLFCKTKGITHLKIDHDKEYTRDLFIAVFVKLYDPDYLECKKQLRAGLREKVAILLSREGVLSGISQLAVKVRDYMQVDKGFRREAEYIYQTIKFELDGKAEKEAGSEEVEAGEVRSDS